MKKEITKHLSKINDDEPYLITITHYPEKGVQLNTSLFFNKFPFSEFESTKEMINELMQKEVENSKKIDKK